jgi:homoaconitase/3-isopropylmalate dehydratase large subunit
VTSKDIILYIISKISAAGATGYFVEYAGSAIHQPQYGSQNDHLQYEY